MKFMILFIIGFAALNSCKEKTASITHPSAEKNTAPTAEEVEKQKKDKDTLLGYQILAVSTKIYAHSMSLYNILDFASITGSHKSAYAKIKNDAENFSREIASIDETERTKEAKSLTVDMLICLQNTISIYDTSDDGYVDKSGRLSIASNTLEMSKAHQRLLLLLPR